MAGEYETICEKDRRRPTEAVLDRIRERYPCEAEIDRVYTRKMQRRLGPGYVGVTIDMLAKGAQTLIESELGYAVRLENVRWLSVVLPSFKSCSICNGMACAAHKAMKSAKQWCCGWSPLLR